MEGYPEEVRKFESKIASREYRKAFFATGSDAGKFVYLHDYSPTNGAGSYLKDASNSAEANMKAEIAELILKDKRNNELSFDKSYQQVKDLVFDYKNEDSGKECFENDKSLSSIESDTLMLVMTRNCVDNKYVLNILKQYGFTNSYLRNDCITLEMIQKLTIAEKNRIKRAYILHQIKTSAPAHPKGLYDNIFIEIVKENYPDQVNQILLDEQGKYLKKKEIIDKKISEIESRLNKSNK